jgi:hypothetical protein
MKKPATKALRLDRTTIARLDGASLPAIAGALPPDTRFTCRGCTNIMCTQSCNCTG